MERRSPVAFYFIGLVAVLVYTNTLIGDFTFDDNFAVITNGDVTNDQNPVAGLFKHDFWGQDIASSQSHKSYRPVTILAFRWTRQAWDTVQSLVPGITAIIPKPPPLPQQQSQQQDTFNVKSPRPPGLHPFPFHVLSTFLHAVVSMMVLALAQHLFAKREVAAGILASQSYNSTTSSKRNQSSIQDSSSSSSDSMLQHWLMWQHQPALWMQPTTKAGQQQAVIAALLFALHPVHTEAVAGVVGCAELICAAWSIPALLLYFMAVDGRYAAAVVPVLQHSAQHASNNRNSTKISTGSSSNSSRTGTSNAAARSKQQRGRAATAAEGSSSSDSLSEVGAAAVLQHWLLVIAAAALAFMAALSKEIGITITGTMVLYDLLLAPHMLPRQLSSSSDGGQQQQRVKVCRRQLLRILLLAAVTVVYIKLRSWVAVQQLVAIYRKVENPIPFASSFLTRLLTTGYLHTRYFGLLLLPWHLSADWSFSCIPLVQDLSDPRNLATLALYAYFLYVSLSARPWACLKQLGTVTHSALSRHNGGRANRRTTAASDQMQKNSSNGSGANNAEAEHAITAQAATSASKDVGCARWRLMIVVGLLIAPFFPASNVLFYVGTFIGERLLYFPSVGYCLLVADLLGLLLPGKAPQQQQQQTGELQDAQRPATWTSSQQQNAAAEDGQHDNVDNSNRDGSNGNRWNLLRKLLVLLVVAVLCVGFAGRTLLRNADWWDEERLFMAAEKVCPDSAKVQQNCGVLQRRYHNFTAALHHFRRAQEIEPGYCEPSYWIALTTINQGHVGQGLTGMKDSLSCKYTSSEALQTLNKLYVMMHENAPGDPMPMVDWAGVLGSQHVLRIADACATAEDAALLAVAVGKSSNYIQQVLDVCLDGIDQWEKNDAQPDTLASLARAKYSSSLNTTLLRECVKLRRVAYKKMTGYVPKSAAVKRAVYKYISKVHEHHPGCRSLSGGGNAPLDSEEAAVKLPSSHQKLLHRVQSADPEDPWLQLEWAQTVLALGGEAALKEAAMHMEVASAIFTRIQQELYDAGTTGVPKHKQKNKQLLASKYTAFDGKAVFTADTALEAAMLPLERFKQAAVNSTAPNVRMMYCEMLKRLCHLKLQMVVLVQQQSANADSSGDSIGRTSGLKQKDSIKAVLNAKAAGRRCLAELSDRRGCEQQSEEVRRMVGRGPA